MSELKAYGINGFTGYVVENENGQLYLKSEADKVIADLEESHKKEVEQLLFEINRLKALNKTYYQSSQLAVDLSIRHQKRKRCLAMAKAYSEKSERKYCEALTTREINKIKGFEPRDIIVKKFELLGAIASMHAKRWRALAAEPTWANFLKLIHKEA